MFVAIMSSESYEWVGLGKTEAEAKRSILKEWNSSERRDRVTLEDLEEWYGFSVYQRKVGEAICWD